MTKPNYVTYVDPARFDVGLEYPDYHLGQDAFVTGERLDIRMYPRQVGFLAYQFSNLEVVKRTWIDLNERRFGRRRIGGVALRGEAHFFGYANPQKIDVKLALMPNGLLHRTLLPSDLEPENVLGYAVNPEKSREEEFVIKSWDVPLSDTSPYAKRQRRIYQHLRHTERPRRLKSAPSFSN